MITSEYFAAILADRSNRLIAEADAYRLAKQAQQPQRRAGRTWRPVRWLRALRSSLAS